MSPEHQDAKSSTDFGTNVVHIKLIVILASQGFSVHSASHGDKWGQIKTLAKMAYCVKLLVSIVANRSLVLILCGIFFSLFGCWVPHKHQINLHSYSLQLEMRQIKVSKGLEIAAISIESKTLELIVYHYYSFLISPIQYGRQSFNTSSELRYRFTIKLLVDICSCVDVFYIMII